MCVAFVAPIWAYHVLVCALHRQDIPLIKPRAPPSMNTGEGSLAKRLSATAINFLEKPARPLDRDVYDEALAWARDVRDTTYADLDSIHAYMVDSTTPGALTLCSTAFYSKWANNRASAYPFDDRQYVHFHFVCLNSAL